MKKLELKKMFDDIVKEGITPNQVYLIYCIDNKELTQNINVHLEIRGLEVGGWVKDMSLTNKGKELISKLNSLYGQTDVKDVTISNIESYNNLFPKKKLPSGKFARTNPKNLELAFKWFFKNFDYTWDIVLNATAAYVDEYEKKNYMYMQTSQYFIRKQQSDKSWGSELANWCAAIEQGDDISDDDYFKQNVV
jgi:hypothetical protein